MFSSSRESRKVRLLALHTTEGILRNSDLKVFFDRPTAEGSCHAASDNFTGLREDGFVPYDRAAWTLRSGNPISDNIEQCGFAKWTTAEWMSRPTLLEGTAQWLAKRSVARNIPLRVLTWAQIKAGESGVIQHNDWTKAMSDGSHWDCGPGYPIDWVINRAKQIQSPTPKPTPTPTPTPTIGDKHMITEYIIPPSAGFRRIRFPIGDASQLYSKGWISALVNGPKAARIRFYFQSLTGGISDETREITFSDGRSSSPVVVIPNGTVQINVQYDMPDGGLVQIEAQAK